MLWKYLGNLFTYLFRAHERADLLIEETSPKEGKACYYIENYWTVNDLFSYNCFSVSHSGPC